jgi:hypothetical protein
VQPHNSSNEPQTADSSTEESSVSSGSIDDLWKAEYESQVHSWRAQSAEAREKAEKERERWEAFRMAEKEDAARRKLEGIVHHPTGSTYEHVEPVSGGLGWENSNKRASEQAVVSLFPAHSLADTRGLATANSAEKVRDFVFIPIFNPNYIPNASVHHHQQAQVYALHTQDKIPGTSPKNGKMYSPP